MMLCYNAMFISEEQSELHLDQAMDHTAQKGCAGCASLEMAPRLEGTKISVTCSEQEAGHETSRNPFQLHLPYLNVMQLIKQ